MANYLNLVNLTSKNRSKVKQITLKLKKLVNALQRHFSILWYQLVLFYCLRKLDHVTLIKRAWHNLQKCLPLTFVSFFKIFVGFKTNVIHYRTQEMRGHLSFPPNCKKWRSIRKFETWIIADTQHTQIQHFKT